MAEERKTKLLVVEDEIYLQRQIKAILTERGYEAATASTRAEAVRYILNDTEISLYLLDVWLPDGDGFDLCRLIRQKNMKPVIFLTACDDEESVVRGLDLGGDDYISKPFRTAELLSRIQANLRRNAGRPSPVMRSGQIRVDTQAGAVQKGGKRDQLKSGRVPAAGCADGEPGADRQEGDPVGEAVGRLGTGDRGQYPLRKYQQAEKEDRF